MNCYTEKVMEKPYLERLNAAQKEAVTAAAGHLLVLAGAGSGKTRVLTCRIAFLIEELGIRPWQILAVTFTNKAAREMRERALLLSLEAEQTALRTFHSFGAYLLRRNADAFNLSPYYTIYDDTESLAVLKRLYPEENLPRLKLYRHLIDNVKNKGLTAEEEWDDTITQTHPLKDIFTAYQAALAQNQAVDFADLIYRPLIEIQRNELLRAELHRRYKAILVDEYQDTNTAQVKLLRLLAGEYCMVTAVGDDDQSIYRFRGADPSNIFDFQHDFSPCRLVKLEQNYRSTGHILNCANAVISHNKGRLGKTLFTESEMGPLPQLLVAEDAEDEVRFCAEKIMADKRYAETAVLYRTNAQSRLFESLFLKLKIPYRLVGTVRFYAREEIKTALALLTILVNPYDESAFNRLIGKPSRGIGSKSQATIYSFRDACGGNMLEAAVKALDTLKGKAASGLASFIVMIKELENLLNTETLSNFLSVALVKSGLHDYYSETDRAEGSSRMENLNELVSALQIYGRGPEALTAFIENVTLDASDMESDDGTDNKVTLITMHNTKGLEYERVFITGMEDNIFPKIDVYSSEAAEELEEERRLCYVAITRARRELYFIYSRRRMLYGRTQFNMPSLFLAELPEEDFVAEGGAGTGESAVNIYAVGSYVRQESYGFGKIVSRNVVEGRLVVEVLFASGKRCKFLPEFSYLEKIDVSELP
jgi:DNA helicase-2/ATP-dependent DNA helicase PcrA